MKDNVSGKKLRVQRGIFCAIPMKSCSSDDDHLVVMQQKIGEFGGERGEREERKKRKCNLLLLIVCCFSLCAYLAYKWVSQKCSLPPQGIYKR